jgi:hypothetical protein
MLIAVHRKALYDLGNSYVSEDPTQVGIEYTYGEIYTYTQGSQLKSKLQHTENLIGRNTTASPPL